MQLLMFYAMNSSMDWRITEYEIILVEWNIVNIAIIEIFFIL